MNARRIRFFILFAALALTVAAAPSIALAQDNSAGIIDSYREWYRLRPSESTFHIGGGFAGVDQSFQMFGRFGLQFNLHPATTDPVNAHPELIYPSVSIVNARIGLRRENWYNAITLAPTGPLDYAPLNHYVDLESLRGQYTSSGLIHFTGEDRQGAPFTLNLSVGNATVWMRGGNDAPCCDFFDYDLKGAATIIFPHPKPHRRDVADLAKRFGRVDPDEDSMLDMDADQVVTLNDLAMAQAMMRAPDEAPAAAAAVPEPSSALLAMLAAAMTFVARRGRRE